MGKMTYEPKYLKTLTKYETNHFSCANCPAKLFNGINRIICAGYGNISAKTMIIFPTYISMNAKLMDKLTDKIAVAYHNMYNTNVLDSVYFTPVIKCYCDNIKYNIKETLLQKCAIKTISEYVQHDSHAQVIFLGDSKEIEMLFQNNIPIVRYISCPVDIFNTKEAEDIFINQLLRYI